MVTEVRAVVVVSEARGARPVSEWMVKELVGMVAMVVKVVRAATGAAAALAEGA